MNERGHYGSGTSMQRSTWQSPQRSPQRSSVGATLSRTLELKQRYDHVATAAVQALLNAFAQEGTVSSTGTYRWEVATRDGVWIRFVWDPTAQILTVTITDKQPRPASQEQAVRAWYEMILARVVTPSLQPYGAVAVGSMLGSPYVGLTAFHGVSDRDTAGAQINTQIETIKNVVLTAAGADPALVTQSSKTADKMAHTPQYKQKVLASKDAIAKSPYKALWYDVVSPVYDEWNSFYADRHRWYDSFTQLFTNWEDYQAWADRVAVLRKKVEDAGIKIDLPPPTALPSSIPEQFEKGFGDVWSIAKYGLWAVLGIGTVVALSSVATNLRSGRDPAAKYVEVIRERRTPRAALSGRRTQLALPPGDLAEVPA